MSGCDTQKLLARLCDGLAMLPEVQRQVYLLSARDGLPLDAIGQRLSLSPEEVQCQLARALVALSRSLDGPPS